MDIYSIGHSTRSFEEFAGLLNEFEIVTLADIRRFPGSRKFPHFNRDHLERALPGAGVRYVWMQELGGRRKSGKGGGDASLNGALRNASFRAYADYMQTPGFVAAVDELLRVADQDQGRVAMMCSEAVYWRCHRRLVSDYLLTRGITVQHIMAPKQVRPHVLTEGGVVDDETVIYPASGGAEGDSGEGSPSLFT